MKASTINHLKSQAKRLKKSNQHFTYCQCLDLVSRELYGVRSFHELRKIIDAQATDSTLQLATIPNEFRANDWPYFDLPQFTQITPA